MPASTKHILTNVERMADDAELLKLWNAEAKAKNADGTERTVGQAWLAFIEAADARHIAARIPGAVGRAFKSRYARDQEESEAPDEAKPAPKRPARKRTAKKASK